MKRINRKLMKAKLRITSVLLILAIKITIPIIFKIKIKPHKMSITKVNHLVKTQRKVKKSKRY